jgi:hypothetical protein
VSNLPNCTCPCEAVDHAITGCMTHGCPCRARRRVQITELVAAPQVQPREWQTAAPPDVYRAYGGGIEMSPDLERVLALPRREPLTDFTDRPGTRAWSMVEAAQARFSRHAPGELIVANDAFIEGRRAEAEAILAQSTGAPCECRMIDARRPQCITRLLPIQAWALLEMREADGLFGCVTTGGGKTFIHLLAPLAFDDCKLALLLIPSSLVDQIATDYRLLSQHFRVPSIHVHGAGGNTFACRQGDDVPILHVLPYSKLSVRTSSEWISRLGPDLVIADECDAFKSRGSARTLRLMRYFNERAQLGRRTRFVGETGTSIDSSITEISHLALIALREHSPLPIDQQVAGQWATAIDPSPMPSDPGELMRLCNPGEDLRSGIRRRLADTLGFIISTSNTQIEIIENGEVVGHVEELLRERKLVEDIPPRVREGLRLVRLWQRPDELGGSEHNDPIEDPMRRQRIALEVASGLFYRWIFPRGEPRTLIDEWYGIRREYFREVRDVILENQANLDSAALCEEAARRYHGDDPANPNLPVWASNWWPDWRDIRNQVQPEQEAVRLDDYLVRDAIAWANERPGILWYSTTEFALWLRELSGMPLHAGGAGAGRELARETGDRSIIASLKAHGRGRDGLQFAFDRNLVIQTPSSNQIWQQVGARTTRRGQKSRLVTHEVYLHTPEIRRAFRQALRRGAFVQEIMGEAQRLISSWRDDHQALGQFDPFAREYDRAQDEETGVDG